MTKEKPENVNRRNREFYDRMKKKGFQLVKLWIHADKVKKIKEMVKRIIEE